MHQGSQAQARDILTLTERCGVPHRPEPGGHAAPLWAQRRRTPDPPDATGRCAGGAAPLRSPARGLDRGNLPKKRLLSQLFRRQRDASLAHLTPDEIAMHPRGHALLEAP